MLIDVIMTLLSEGRRSFDQHGATPARGSIDEDWVRTLLEHPYYRQALPKRPAGELYSPGMGAQLLDQGRQRRAR